MGKVRKEAINKMAEIKFKNGDKVQTNDRFRETYPYDPGFKGIVTSTTPAYFMPGTEREEVTLHTDVKTWKNGVSINQDFLDLYYGDLEKEERLLKAFDVLEKEVIGIKKKINAISGELDNVLEVIKRYKV